MVTNILATDKNLYDMLCDIVGEDLDTTAAARLLSSAKNELEREEKLEILVDEDTSKTNAAGDTYTSMHALPTDFRFMLKLYVGIIEYAPTPFRNRINARNSARRYYIDHKNNQFAICGVGSGNTITQVYLIKTDDITAATIEDATSATLLWPNEHWEVVVWHAAQLLSSGTDTAADDVSFRMTAAQRNRYNELRAALKSWNQDLVLQSMDNRTDMNSEADDDTAPEEVLPYL